MEKNPDLHREPHTDERPSSDEKLPAAHAVQLAEEKAASAVEYSPAAHAEEHEEGSPYAEEYVPGAQETQTLDDVAARAVE